MEFLTEFDQPLKITDEIEYVFYDINSFKEYIFGCPIIEDGIIKKVADLQPIIDEDNDRLTDDFLADSNTQPSGARLRFYTDSPYIILKAELKRKYAHGKMLLYCSSGFDVYYGDRISGQLTHQTVVAPNEPNNIFAEKIYVVQGKFTEIYFPNYNCVKRLAIGIENGCSLSAAPLYKHEKTVLFYGNSMTQGASASRSGNAFPNIVSRQFNCNIVNYSFSGACRGELSMADAIGKDENSVGAVVIDYSRNATSLDEFKNRFEPFCSRLRKYYPHQPFILIGAYKAYGFTAHIKEVYKRLKQENESVFFIDPDKLFSDLDQIALSIDNIHYTDIGMFRIADEICKILDCSM
ncbi:MAG: hypothetical protein J1E39_05660 [Eubacterium sp.]|nr:hypothetical protein [Eubacterium sp.]